VYWKGKREVEFDFIEVKDANGKCQYEDGFYNISTSKGCLCSDWRGFPSDDKRQS
jgi:hypothetical protein